MRRSLLPILVLLLLQQRTARADWFEPASPYRRTLSVQWNADQTTDDIAVADFFTAGHARADGRDIHVISKTGRSCPIRILKSGTDDADRILFQLQPGEKDYVVYWGNSQSIGKRDAELFPIHFGMLFESRGLQGASGPTFAQLQKSWDAGGPDLGGQMIDRPFIGYNPCTTTVQTINRLTGSLFAPANGDYELAGACDDVGAVWIDDVPTLVIPACVGDTRFNKTIHLARGRHNFLLLHANTAGPMIISVGWKQPGDAAVQIIDRQSFGICKRGMPGSLEKLKQSIVADFTADHVAETFEHLPGASDSEQGNYSNLYRFKASQSKENASIKFTWAFGDGQVGSGPSVDHVFLTPGVYPVTLTCRIGGNSETEINRISVQRDWSQGNQPQTNDPPVQATIVGRYDIATMPEHWLSWAAKLQFDAGDSAAALAVGKRIASEPMHADANLAFSTLSEITAAASVDRTIDLWQYIPIDSDLQPRGVMALADLLLWDKANFADTIAALRPFEKRHESGIDRRLADALLLAGEVKEARRLMSTLHTTEPPDRAAAISGAMARTVEYALAEKNASVGRDAWEKWQNRFPDQFQAGYSALLRVKMMKLEGNDAAAARVAEGFAMAVPTSSYAPQLLQEASTLIATVDPIRSRSLRALLKQRYPEDPLSQ